MIRPRLTAPLVAAVLLLTLAAGCARKSVQAPPAGAPPASSPDSPGGQPPARPDSPSGAPQEPAREGELSPVFFAYDSDALDETARTVLDRNAKLLRERGGARVTIEGHCDERGTVEYNQALGERRAQAAAAYLAAAGVAMSRIDVVSFGKDRPFDEGHGESAWAKNRRAHFVLR